MALTTTAMEAGRSSAIGLLIPLAGWPSSPTTRRLSRHVRRTRSKTVSTPPSER